MNSYKSKRISNQYSSTAKILVKTYPEIEKDKQYHTQK